MRDLFMKFRKMRRQGNITCNGLKWVRGFRKSDKTGNVLIARYFFANEAKPTEVYMIGKTALGYLLGLSISRELRSFKPN